MTSKTSFFNKSLMRRDLARMAPMAGAFFVIWLFILPIGLYSGYTHRDFAENTLETISRYLFSVNQIGISFSAFLTGMAAAWFSFHDYFAAKSTNFYAQLPISRKTQFWTHYLDGLLVYIVPSFVVYLFSAILCAAIGTPIFALFLEAFASHMLSYLFFYSFGVFCCMIISNAAAMPILYLILNFSVPLVTIILSGIVQCCTYGMPEQNVSGIVKFSPMLRLSTDGSYTFANDSNGFSDYHIRIWGYLIAIAAVGLLMTVLSYLLFKSRRMECSGDVIAVRWLRPVFRVLFTLGCGIVIGALVITVFTNGYMQYASPFAVGSALVFGAFLGNFAALMMLKKTIRVFRHGWGGFFLCGILLIAFVVILQLDVSGYVKYVPQSQEVAAVILYDNTKPFRNGNIEIEDPEIIEKTTALHRRFVAEKNTLQSVVRQKNGGYYTSHFDLAYCLKDGRLLTRSYAYPSYYDPAKETELDISKDVTALFNDPAVILANCAPSWDVRPEQFLYASVNFVLSADNTGKNYQDFTLGNYDAYEMFTTCILPDLKDSSLGMTNRPSEMNYPYQALIQFALTNENGEECFYNYNVSRDAKRTVEYLKMLGLKLN